MKQASEYRQHAAECRKLAQRMEAGEHRDQLLRMAATWEALADQRREPAAPNGEEAVKPKETSST
jgi:hypothetical protein